MRHCQTNSRDKPDILIFSTEEMDSAITRINGRNGRRVSFEARFTGFLR
jgi:hypothetical protein